MKVSPIVITKNLMTKFNDALYCEGVTLVMMALKVTTFGRQWSLKWSWTF